MASLWPLDQVSNAFRLGEPRSPSLKFVAGAGFEPATSGYDVRSSSLTAPSSIVARALARAQPSLLCQAIRSRLHTFLTRTILPSP
jgi:hypothetical protein